MAITANVGNQQQERIVRGAEFSLNTAAGAGSPRNAPVNGPAPNGTVPHCQLSPIAPAGATMGAILGLSTFDGANGLNPAQAIAAGFTLTVWLRNPTSYAWYSMQSFSAPYNQAFICTDFDACELYIQIAAASIAVDGTLRVSIMEI